MYYIDLPVAKRATIQNVEARVCDTVCVRDRAKSEEEKKTLAL
jgi:hypothetical protein